ncbi:MAG: reverse transcriptase family protein [Bacteroidia bacterium]
MIYTFYEFKSRLTAEQVKNRAMEFAGAKHLTALASMLKLEKHQLTLLAGKPGYDRFHIPKPKGGKRLIETPRRDLKKAQRRLSQWLQCVYYTLKPPSAFGFIISPENDPTPCNIYTNAAAHIGREWVLNVDLKDFFHQITQEKVKQIFLGPPFQFTPKAARCMARLTTFKSRLPMGAPTSPVLSNFACREMDQHIIQLAQKQDWTYTRYADDITLSSKEEITPESLQMIRQTIQADGFDINPDKVRISHIDDKPEVTGLVLGKKPDVSKQFIKGIKADIQMFQNMTSDRMISRDIFSQREIVKLQRSIKGQINFVAFVRGKDHKSCRKLRQRLEGKDLR